MLQAKKYNGLMKRWYTKKDSPTPEISIVVSIYNKLRDLEICLEGYLRQSFQNFELILADDGSKPEIEEFLKSYSGPAKFPLTYLRQEDHGWGKSRMLNWSVLEARAERMVFTDGDCIPHKHFVRSHAQESNPNSVACGRRVDLFDQVSAKLSQEDIRSGKIENPLWLLGNAVNHKIDFGQQGLHLPYMVARTLTLFYRSPRLLGSNMGVHKKHLIEINGFDESFTVPGVGEDTDMQRRFEMAGLKIKWITYRAVQYHLWHDLTTVGAEAHGIYDKIKSLNQATAVKGIKEFLPEFNRYDRP